MVHGFIEFKGNKGKKCPERQKSRLESKGWKLYPKTKEGISTPTRREVVEKDQQKNMASDSPLD